ncbi:MAG TPA: hypothetical protein DIT99_19990, partial [Candidatus Latescibacteria bacterium]|nr:hypothetical protein [Candidatus Latescibacterota bacterium]
MTLLMFCGLLYSFPSSVSGQNATTPQDSLDIIYEGDLIEVTATRYPRLILDVPYAIESIDLIQIQRGEIG